MTSIFGVLQLNQGYSVELYQKSVVHTAHYRAKSKITKNKKFLLLIKITKGENIFSVLFLVWHGFISCRFLETFLNASLLDKNLLDSDWLRTILFLNRVQKKIILQSLISYRFFSSNSFLLFRLYFRMRLASPWRYNFLKQILMNNSMNTYTISFSD